MSIDKKIRTVYHLHLNKDNNDIYFGSMAAMYHYYDEDKDGNTSAKDKLGITIESLTNYFNRCKQQQKEYIYINALCRIRKAPLITNATSKDEASSE